jgi:hypothetical protein
MQSSYQHSNILYAQGFTLDGHKITLLDGITTANTTWTPASLSINQLRFELPSGRVLDHCVRGALAAAKSESGSPPVLIIEGLDLYMAMKHMDPRSITDMLHGWREVRSFQHFMSHFQPLADTNALGIPHW